jgi:hypothetical protein
MKKTILWAVGSLFLVLLALSGTIMSRVEQAEYKVLESYGPIEIREYSPMIVAEAHVPGERQHAINQGFREIADYIFGNNTSSAKVEMTAPVTQQLGEKIDMTAPVTQTEDGGDWIVRFVMPKSHSIETLPKPNNNGVELKSLGAKTLVVIRFSGAAENKLITQKTSELDEFIKASSLNVISGAIYAFYNPPWTLPFLRRNEVMVEIDYKKDI